MQRDFVQFIDYVPHIPQHKRQESLRLFAEYMKWREDGGIPTIVTREMLKAGGPRKLSKRVGMMSERAMSGQLPGYKIIPEKVG